MYLIGTFQDYTYGIIEVENLQSVTTLVRHPGLNFVLLFKLPKHFQGTSNAFAFWKVPNNEN